MFKMCVRTLFVLFCVFVCGFNSEAKKSKFVIDNDAGGDDAMAIFLGLLYEKHYDGPELIALTTGNGNTIEDNVCSNNQKVLKIAGRQDVPIYRGSKSAIVHTPTVTDYYGKDGLGDSGDVYTDLVEAQEENAVDALIRLAKTYEGDLTIVTIGTLTNVALAVRIDPDFINRLNHLYIGAGHIHSDADPEPEFNAHMDVEAYHIIAQKATPDKVTLLPFSQIKKHLSFSKEWRENVLGAIQSDIIKAQNKFEKVSLTKEERWQALDPAVVTMFVKPELVEEYKYSKNDIVTCGEKRGLNTNTFCEKDEANVRIVYSVKTEEYKQFLLDVFTPKDIPESSVKVQP